ncbi:MAG: squalene/phytoene synthase family protein [Gammaproteobacteria bacterium]|nr:squalene/phytoene synthase family protein [Gammaproteobacteria bacterium]
MDPVLYCRDKVAPPGSSLHYALMFLDPSRRRAALGLFAFQRQVLEISQRSRDPAPRQAQLDWWRAEWARCAAGQPGHHASQLLAEARLAINLPQELFQEILEASAMDVEGAVYPDFKALSLYVHRRSACLWLLAAEIFGYRERQTVKYAHELGTALELSRMVLELGPDLAHGQLYLPLDELERHGIAPEQLLRGERPAGFAALMHEQVQRIDRHFAEAERHLPAADRATQHPGQILAVLSRARLAKALAQDFPVLAHSPDLSPLRKLWMAWRTHARARR